MVAWKGIFAGALVIGVAAHVMTPVIPGSKLASESDTPKPAATGAATLDPTARDAAVAPANGRRPAIAERAVLPGDDLAGQIQSELRRIGCYSGPVDGRWGNGTRTAVRQFGERVRLDLRTDEPSFILLSLARRQPSNSCRTSEPSARESVPLRGRPADASPAADAARAPVGGPSPALRAPASVARFADTESSRDLERKFGEAERRAEIAAIEARRRASPAMGRAAEPAPDTPAARPEVAQPRLLPSPSAARPQPGTPNPTRSAGPEAPTAAAAAPAPAPTAPPPLSSEATPVSPMAASAAPRAPLDGRMSLGALEPHGNAGRTLPSSFPAQLPPATEAAQTARRHRHQQGALTPAPRRAAAPYVANEPIPRQRPPTGRSWVRSVFQEQRFNGP